MLLTGDVQVEHGLRPAVSQVADDRHLAVRNEVGCAFRIAQNSDTQGNLLDLAGEAAEVVAADFDDIADDVLLLEQHQETGEIVLHEALCAEGDGDANDGDTAEQRPNGYADFFENGDTADGNY